MAKLYEPTEKQRRKHRAGLAVKAILLSMAGGALAGFAYMVGVQRDQLLSERLEADLAQARIDLADAQRDTEDLQEAQAALRSSFRAAQDRNDALSALLPDEAMAPILEAAKTKVEAGLPPDYIRQIVAGLDPTRECGEPELHRFLVRTPLSRGEVSENAAGFDQGGVTVSASGASARNSGGAPEAWFDPTAQIRLGFARRGGTTDEVQGILPMDHALVFGGKEYRFSAEAAGQRGMITVTARICSLW
jgi:hypothetical protein